MDRSCQLLADPAGTSCIGSAGTLSARGDAAARSYVTLGIDVGSVNVKVCGLAGAAVRHAVVAHAGDVEAALDVALAQLGASGAAAPTLATGGTGRRRIDVSDAIAPCAVEAALQALLQSRKPLGVLPLGTLNHFAKDVGIPLDLDQAVATIAGGHVSIRYAIRPLALRVLAPQPVAAPGAA